MAKKIIVIGGGPAGLMAAAKASEKGHHVVLFEKKEKTAKKLRISGKGRCNITNDTDIEGLIENIPGNGNFLYSAFYTFSNHDLVALLSSIGLETKVERGGRIFPASDRADDVAAALVRYAEKNGADMRLDSAVKEIRTEDGKVSSVILQNGRKEDCDAVILATGGASYPGTGSTGDGYRMAQRLGHTVIPPKPSLVPLETEEAWVKEMQGLSLKNVSLLLANKKGKKLYQDFGEMLFTHFGVSGPLILSCSRHIPDFNYGDARLLIDLKPALSEEKLDERIQRDFESFSRKQYKNSLHELLPMKMIPVMIHLSGISPEKPVNQITRDERRTLVRLLKSLPMTVKGARPIAEAIVTAGGVSTDEINPSTMESKKIGSLYFAGEIIDVDGYTGGFNLTIAFSTGYVAGISC